MPNLFDGSHFIDNNFLLLGQKVRAWKGGVEPYVLHLGKQFDCYSKQRILFSKLVVCIQKHCRLFGKLVDCVLTLNNANQNG